MSRSPRSRTAVLPAVIASLAVAAAVLTAWLDRGADDGAWKSVLMTAVWVVPGVLVSALRPRSPLGWLALGEALLFALAGLAAAWTRTAHAAGGGGTGLGWAVWFTDRFSALLAVGVWLLLVLLPDGRLPSARWRPVVRLVLGAQLGLVAVFALARGPAAGPDSSAPAALAGLPNPVGVLPGGWGEVVQDLADPVLQLPLLLCLLALGLRLRRSGGEERAQVVSVLVAAATLVLVVLLGHAWWPQAAFVLDVLAAAVLATALTAAALGRRPRAVDLLVRESIVLTVLAATVGGLAAAATALGVTGGSAFATGALVGGLALAAHPLRVRLQRLVERALHGDAADPYRALQRLADSTHRAPTLTGALAGAAASARLSLRVERAVAAAGDRTAASGARPAGGTDLTVPLLCGAEELGSLTVTTGRRLSTEERSLLEDLGRHGGVAVRAVLLAEELQAGRRRLVLAREEERRRLRRDLHDDVGPTLAGLTMQLGVVRSLVDADPRAAADRLGLLQDAARTALATLRRLAHDLRPPALDQLGPAGALERLAASLGLRLTTSVAADLRLPAAVEVAAYRIGAEALHNVVRHAGTDRVDLRLAIIDGDLVLEVRDDGAGRRPGAPAGVGLLGMRERADELGGSVLVDSAPGAGTTVTARLPVPSAVPAEVPV